jgi:lysozyme
LDHPVSDTAARHRRKVSREGIVLLKSFEGFRARAERDGDGWVIGYGHRQSAREGLSVAEADAELLLQYDLLPIVKALNDLPAPELNGHQFDALASFAFSIGLDRFLASEVFRRLVDQRPAEAADALLDWTEPAPPNAGVRRRAAERALFMADPDRPVALSDLLSAPLPPPNPEAGAAPTPTVAADERQAAVAALLGEAPLPAEVPTPDPIVVPAFAAVADAPTPPDPQPEADPQVPDATEQDGDAGPVGSGPVEEAPVEPDAGLQPTTPAPANLPMDGAPAMAPTVAPSAPFQRLAPYSGLVVGPLPGFPPLAGRPVALPDPTPAPLPLPTPEPEPEPEPPVEIEAARPVETTGAFVTPTAPEPLTLTPSPEREPETGRTAWEDAARPATEAVDQAPLFQDAPQAVSILRHEAEPEAPRRFDWSETGMYLIMGGLGLVSCAVSAAAFRVAVEDPSPMGETTAVAWTLAVIGAVCVGAASWHLYVRTTRRKG